MSEYVASRSLVFRANQRLITKDELTPEEERIIRQFANEFGDVLDGPESDLLARIRSGDVDFSRLSEVRQAVRDTMGDYTTEMQGVIRENVEEGMGVGRQVAASQFDLEGAFDVTPDRLLDQLDEWSIESTNEVVDSMSDEVARTLRSTAEDGYGIDEMSDVLQRDVFEGRLKDSKAEEIARTETISASNEGAHSAYEDADGVIGEEWLASGDQRTRDSHAAADGQIVAVDGTFLIAGHEAEHPGDKSLPPGEFVQCRCTVVPVFADDLTDAQVATIMDGGRIGV